MPREIPKASALEYARWVATVPAEITTDRLWTVRGYRPSLFASEVGWQDVGRLARDPRGRVFGDQLLRALASISANIAEGFSRGFPKDRARFYEYALGRESRDWYYKARHVLGMDVTARRLELLTCVVRLLLAMVPHQRGRSLVVNLTARSSPSPPPDVPTT